MMNLLERLGQTKPCAGDWAESEIVGTCMYGTTPVENPSFPQQPVNSWSNLAYAAAGWLVYLVSSLESAIVFALAMTFLAFGSFMYHAWPTAKTAALDHAGMYGVFLALVFSAVGPDVWWVVAVAAGLGAWVFRYAFSFHLNSMMGLFLAIAMAYVVRSGDLALGLISFSLFAAAMTAWYLDRARYLLGRYGHGVWHLLTAAAIAMMYAAL